MINKVKRNFSNSNRHAANIAKKSKKCKFIVKKIKVRIEKSNLWISYSISV